MYENLFVNYFSNNLQYSTNRGGRFWPKSGCDGSGHNCEVGQSVDPCNPGKLKFFFLVFVRCSNEFHSSIGGCDPPAETKVEFFFPPAGDPGDVWYDVSLVDGYSLPAEIVPSVQVGSCVTTNCHISLASCPTNEDHVGDLRLVRNGRTIKCLAPCKSELFVVKMNFVYGIRVLIVNFF